MPFDIRSYKPMPLVLVNFTGNVSAADIRAMYKACDEARRAYGASCLWRILNLTESELDFPTVMQIVKEAEPDKPGQFADAHIQTLLLSTHKMSRLLSDLFARESNGGASLTIMPGLGEALLYAQDEIFSNQAGAGG